MCCSYRNLVWQWDEVNPALYCTPGDSIIGTMGRPFSPFSVSFQATVNLPNGHQHLTAIFPLKSSQYKQLRPSWSSWSLPHSRTYRISPIWKSLLQTHKTIGASIYLLLGTSRALVLDTEMLLADLTSSILKITDKPFDVAVTHGHIASINEFSQIYIHPNDRSITYSEL
jgi:hypothetical protein